MQLSSGAPYSVRRRYREFKAPHSLLATHYSLLTTHSYPLLTTHAYHLLLSTHSFTHSLTYPLVAHCTHSLICCESEALHAALVQQHGKAAAVPALPPSDPFSLLRSPGIEGGFLRARAAALHTFLQQLVATPLTAAAAETRAFLNMEVRHAPSDEELALALPLPLTLTLPLT